MNMTEQWLGGLVGEAFDVDAALRSLLASMPECDEALRDAFDDLAQKPLFSSFTWLWGPVLWQRNPVFFRPFILRHFSSLAFSSCGEAINPWKGATAAPLEQWLCSVDAADDVDLTLLLYKWRLEREHSEVRIRTWREDLVRRFAAASCPATRSMALAKLSTGWKGLDGKTATALYETDPVVASPFVLNHLPLFERDGKNARKWAPLLRMSRDRDADFHFRLYRWIVDEKKWRDDVLELCRTVGDPNILDAELERRHPQTRFDCFGKVFLQLVQAREHYVIPYILRHVSEAFPILDDRRQQRAIKRQTNVLLELVNLARENGWLDLWAGLLRSASTMEVFNSELDALLHGTVLSERDVRMRLCMVAGLGKEACVGGVSVHSLNEDTALVLYERFPDLVRAPFRMHVAPNCSTPYPRLIRAAINGGDLELVGFLASRVGIQEPNDKFGGWNEAIETLTWYFEALSEHDFARWSSDVLSRMPSFALRDYDKLLQTNRFARLLFEQNPALYLCDATAVRNLLESPLSYVQVLALRVLGCDDPRVCQLAANNADLLQAMLFQRMRRSTRLLVFKALESAAKHDEATAVFLVGKMREALVLPQRHFPTEQLVGLIGKVLHWWPSACSPREVARVYGEVPA